MEKGFEKLEKLDEMELKKLRLPERHEIIKELLGVEVHYGDFEKISEYFLAQNKISPDMKKRMGPWQQEGLCLEWKAIDLAYAENKKEMRMFEKLKKHNRPYLIGPILDVTGSKKAEFEKLMHPQGRIQYYAEFSTGEYNYYQDLKEALNAYTSAGAVDVKTIGFAINGEENTALAKFDIEDFKNQVIPIGKNARIYTSSMITINELKEIENSMKEIEKVLDKENTYFKTDIRVLTDEKRINDEIQKAGYRPTKRLVADMKRVNVAFQKNLSVKEVRDMFKGNENISLDKRELIHQTAKDFIQAEKAMVKFQMPEAI